MYLEEIFQHLTSGEYRKIKLGGSRSIGSEILPEDYHIVLPAVNLAIYETHKRLPMRTESVTIQQYSNITFYRIHSDFAQTNTESDMRYKYILDSKFFPYQDTLITVNHVYDMGGHVLPINDRNDLDTVYLPKHDTVQLPYPDNRYTFDVEFQATLPKIPISEDIDPKTYVLDLPTYALQPVLAFIQSRSEIGMIRGENIQAEFASLTKFETACQLIEKQSLIKPEGWSNTRIHDHGWV